MKKNEIHTFVICAYKEEKNLVKCVESLVNQTSNSEVIISTSTPNDFIKKVAKDYKVKLAINKKRSNHIKDFYFAFEQAKTKYVSLCHQDDIYFPNFGTETIEKMEKHKDSLIAFTDYCEIRNDKIIKNNILLNIKRIMNFTLLFFKKSRFVRKIILSFGNSICCPTVTYNKNKISYPLIENFGSNADWATYITFSKMKGRFIYINKVLVGHRIHRKSTTSKTINDNSMREQNYKIFCLLWPKWIAKLIAKVYCLAEKSNELK